MREVYDLIKMVLKQSDKKVNSQTSAHFAALSAQNNVHMFWNTCNCLLL